MLETIRTQQKMSAMGQVEIQSISSTGGLLRPPAMDQAFILDHSDLWICTWPEFRAYLTYKYGIDVP